MWGALVEAAAGAGWHALAPDLPGYGDSPPDPPHTWQRMVDAVDAFHEERAAVAVALCVHDWGGLIGLRWACDHPEKVRALVICATGFFPDGKWHGLAKAMRTEGEGEEIVDGTTREAFGQMLAAVAPGIGERAIDEYFKASRTPCAAAASSSSIARRLRRARALSGAARARSASRRCCSSAPRTPSRASPARIASRGDPARAHRGARRHRALHVRRGARARGGDRRGLPRHGLTARLALDRRRLVGVAPTVTQGEGSMQVAHAPSALPRPPQLSVVLAPAASAHQGHGAAVPTLNWQPCGDAANVTCTTARVPLDYDRPKGQSIKLFVAKSPATGQKIGSLFINFGGPGGTRCRQLRGGGRRRCSPRSTSTSTSSGWIRAGSGQSEPAIDCKANQETDGHLLAAVPDARQPQPRALVNKDLRYIARAPRSTARSCRTCRRPTWRATSTCCARPSASSKITYFGYSYGTFLGATYASLFPHNYRSWCSTGRWTRTRTSTTRSPPERAERGLRARARAFLRGLRGRRGGVPGFGNGDPRDEFDQLVEQLDAQAIPAGGDDPRPVDGDDVLAARRRVYNKGKWPLLAQALAERPTATERSCASSRTSSTAATTTARSIPSSDRYFTLSADEQRYPAAIDTYLRRASARGGEHEHRGGTAATTSSTRGCGRSATATRSPGRSRSTDSSPSRRWSWHDVRPGDAVSRRQEPGRRARQRPAADACAATATPPTAATRPASTPRSRPT